MPQFPGLNPNLAGIGHSVYGGLAAVALASGERVAPLHIGDTWLEPAVGLRLEDLRSAERAGLHRYGPPEGDPALREALAGRASREEGRAVGVDEVLVAAGATAALQAVVAATTAPGDEVIILAPHWPLVAGIVRQAQGVPVRVDVLDVLDQPEALLERVRAALTARTVALYVNSPHNPSGKVIPGDALGALAGLVRAAGLWWLADEVYSELAWGRAVVPMRGLAPERTVTLGSASKAFGMAGNRVGWAIGPASVIDMALRVATHTWYAAPTGPQRSALAALGPLGQAWLSEARERYQALGEACAERLGQAKPEGSTFLFVDLSAYAGGRELPTLLRGLAERGVLVAPGPSFGDFPNHVRVCFTSAEPELVLDGVGRMARFLGI